MTHFYPPIDPYAAQHLRVSELHSLYVEECGRRDGLPVVFLHGGPGAGCEPWHRRFFDPSRYRIVLFDQRGCGRSRPHAELTDNTTPHLIDDIEAIRRHLGIERWVVFGGSWGSTLALAYAEAHPERVLGLILRGIFLCRPREIHWFYQEGANRIFPDLWLDYLAPIPLQERGDLVQAYHRRLTGRDEIARMAAAKAWSIWEGRTATLLENRAVVDHFADPHTALSLARIECHYFVHDAFLRPNQLLQEAHRLAPSPASSCRGATTWSARPRAPGTSTKAWPTAELKIIPDAGHSAAEPATRSALIDAADRFAIELGQG
jgi:proline iminopeptidase